VFGIDRYSVYTDLINKHFLHSDFILAETIVLGNPRWLPDMLPTFDHQFLNVTSNSVMAGLLSQQQHLKEQERNLN
jgi:hypothetical protein